MTSEAEICPICAAGECEPRIESTDYSRGGVGEFTVLVCSNCGAGVSRPIMGSAELASHYDSDYGPHQAISGPILTRISAAIRAWQSWRAFRTRPIAAVASDAPGRILDVGCGRGDLAGAFVSRGWEATGIEPSEVACEEARSKGVEAIAGTISSIELEPESQDVVIFNHSLEHVDDPVPALGLALRALRPGGRLLVSVPNFGNWQRRALGAAWYPLDLPRHRVHFTPAAMRVALERAGFEPGAISASTYSGGFGLSLQYRLLGRPLFRGGLGARVVPILATAPYPIVRLIDAMQGSGDVLHAVARRPS